PPMRSKARDGFCPIGPRVVARHEIADATALGVRVFVDGLLVHRSDTSGWIRSPERLLAEVSDFMTLLPGDVLMTGVAHGAPKVHAGQRVAIEIDGLGRLENAFVAAQGTGA
ncbi:MAG: fumarylacetoacetate hydrolase family protein, partial [Pseudomonadota bacterium]|nr:fumarylacetoacetate hydrolase family protein [Pseudomonadota bacterium]